MSAVRVFADRWAGNRSAIYEFELDNKSGVLYLRRQRSRLVRELPFAALLLIAMIFTMGSYCRYIRLRTSVECSGDRTEALQRQYLELQSDNVTLERALYQTPDLTAVYEIATGELGMIPVTRDHLILYQQSNGEFVYQTDNIPIIGFQ